MRFAFCVCLNANYKLAVSLLCLTFMSCIVLVQCRVVLANYHPSDFVHGLLAAHVYETSANGDSLLAKKHIFYDLLNVADGHQKDVVIRQLLTKWSVHEVIYDQKTDYYGTIYKNDVDKQLMLAHRGTHLLGSFFEDLNGVVNFKITEFNLKFKETTRKVVDLIKMNANFTGYALSFTGHSLGAWIADLSVYYCHRFFDYKNVKAVTFDAPGSEIMLQLLDKPAIKGPVDTFDVRKLDIVSYLSMPNLVNSVNRHVGLCYLVNNTDYDKQVGWIERAIEFASDKMSFSRLANEHSLRFILEKFNHQTGRPFRIQQVERWPSITLTITNNVLSQDLAVNSMYSFLQLISSNVYVPFLNVPFSNVLSCIASYTLRGSKVSNTIQQFVHFVNKAIGSPIEFKSAVYSDTEQFRLVAQYVAQNKYNVSIEHAEIYFKVKERELFDGRYIVDSIDESINA